MARGKRGIGTAILAILTVIGGAFVLLAGLGLVLVGGAASVPFASVLGLSFVGMGLLFVFAGIGLWQLKAWAWWLAVVLSALDIVGVVVGLLGWTSAIIPAVILAYLILVMDDFRIRERRRAPAEAPRKRANRGRPARKRANRHRG